MDIRSLGLRDYVEVWALQRELVERRQRGDVGDTLLLCEHAPVYTRGEASKTPVPPGLPHPIHTIERGGDITYHGPGQLVGYPILELAARGLRPRSYLRALEASLAEALSPLGVRAETVRGFTGLWCGGKKIVSIGVAVKGAVTYHGFALNVSCDLAPFAAIHPCNLEPDQMTTLERVLGRPVPMAEVEQAVARVLPRLGPVAVAA